MERRRLWNRSQDVSRSGILYYHTSHPSECSRTAVYQRETFGQETFSVTEYTMSEIIASVYEKMEKQVSEKEFFLLMRLTAYQRPWRL